MRKDCRDAVRTKRNDYTHELKRYGLDEEAKEIDSILEEEPFFRYSLRGAASKAILLANWRLRHMAIVYYTAIVNHLKGLYQSDLTKHFGGNWSRFDELAAEVLGQIQSELKQQKSSKTILNDTKVVEFFGNFETKLRKYREEVGTFFFIFYSMNSTDNAYNRFAINFCTEI